MISCHIITYVICGPDKMVENAMNILGSLRIKNEFIHRI
jgi:hypothetical protein